MEVKNAKVVGVSNNPKDWVIRIVLDYGGSQQNFDIHKGNYSHVSDIIEPQYVRVERSDYPNPVITRIGHILEERWYPEREK